jgi:hypothetical protein
MERHPQARRGLRAPLREGRLQPEGLSDFAFTPAAKRVPETMAEFTIRPYGDPVLRAKGDPVKEFGPALRSLGDAMLRAMKTAKGIGLARPAGRPVPPALRHGRA